MRVFASDRHRAHAPQHEIESSGLQDPFEHPGRADSIRAALDADDRFDVIEPPVSGTMSITSVHDAGLVRFLETAWSEYQRDVGARHDVVPDVFAVGGLREGMGDGVEPKRVAARLGWWCFETTTPLTEGTYDAACSAADAAVAAASAVMGGERTAYALCRPPGHHATRSLYGGYCFFNNAAIAAQHLVDAGAGRVTVLDVDYHHGNGTQQLLYDRGDVQFVSLHADPDRAYPYHTGFADETGAGAGRGTNLNLPLDAGVADEEYLDVLGRACEAIDAFDPAAVVVSLGVDTFVGDPMCDLALTTDGFERCGRAVGALGRPMVVVQEGGYAVSELGENVRRWLLGAAADIRPLPSEPSR